MNEVFSRHGIKPNVSMTAENDHTVMALVSKSFGFSIFPELSLSNLSFPLVQKELEVQAYRELAIAVRSRETASAATLEFLSCVQQWVRDFYEQKV
jgi:DNA-binding transcriptional LysR family regulator